MKIDIPPTLVARADRSDRMRHRGDKAGLPAQRNAIRTYAGTHGSVKMLAGLCLADAREPSDPLGRRLGDLIMPTFSPELIQTMRAVLEEVMTKVPLEQATPGIKAQLAECILKAAAKGQTSYEGLTASAADQLQTILSMFT